MDLLEHTVLQPKLGYFCGQGLGLLAAEELGGRLAVLEYLRPLLGSAMRGY